MNMNSSKTSLRKHFNEKYFEFLNFLETLIVTDEKSKMFKSFYSKNVMMRKANPSFFIKKWYVSITVPYYQQIMNDNIEFFLNKDNFIHTIKNDSMISKNDYEKFQMEKNLQGCIQDYDKMSEDQQDLLISSIKNLTMICILYFKK